jgi:hypothetical protein
MNTENARTFLPSIKRFFGGKTPYDSGHRSSAGLLMTLVLVPVLLGVMACLPVPVGNPDKSRIDPAMSGVWIGLLDGDATIMVLDPYDKRTWLMSLIALDTGQDDQPEKETSLLQLLDPDRRDQIKIKHFFIYKTWLTKIKGVSFMTWESKNLAETLPEMVPEYWLVFRVRRSGDAILYLDEFDYTVDGLDKVKTRKEAEKIIRRHLDDPEFFDEDPYMKLHRVPESDYETVSQLLGDFGSYD